ncbi:MAG: ketol-acid reductoisomerase [Desulfuromonadales bacterium]|nr:ketol-acid reductoisomerase [Desulfuromonadales bacterium]MBN2791196.1 ketol-acid reductoisomerase [Desulfuromonadales bacterium]
MGQNYFSSLPFRRQVEELGNCRFMDSSEFNGVEYLKGKKIVIVGCGAQGLNQGLNLRDSGLDVSYALRKIEIDEKHISWENATENNFEFDTIENMVPKGDLVLNLTPDKYHTPIVNHVMPLMKKGACLSYSHGFNIVEEGMQIRDDLTVIMVAPKSPGSEVRAEYLRGFGVPTLIAVHGENDPNGDGLDIAKAYCCGTGGDRAGVLFSSFTAEVKSDLMGEQTILCGVLQTGSILFYNKMVEAGIDSGYACKLVQYGWETVTEALKHGGITNMMDRLSNPAKLAAYDLAEELKEIMTPLFHRHMDDILSGKFSETMMKDWANDDADLLRWREATNNEPFEQAVAQAADIPEQEYFDNGILMVAMVKAGVELAFDIMVESGMQPESAYYESLHETPLIANLIARKKLYEMNKVISDTAEYGCYLFAHTAVPLLKDFMADIDTDVIGKGLNVKDNGVDNQTLVAVNAEIRNTLVEEVGEELRSVMQGMKAIL